MFRDKKFIRQFWDTQRYIALIIYISSGNTSISIAFPNFPGASNVTAVNHRGLASYLRNFYNYAYCFRGVRVSHGGDARLRALVRERRTHIEPCGVSYIRQTSMHDRRRHLVRLPSPIINARHMPRSLIRRFYMPVCPVCLWWHVTAVKAAPALGFPSSIQFLKPEKRGLLINTARINPCSKEFDIINLGNLHFFLLNLVQLF